MILSLDESQALAPELVIVAGIILAEGKNGGQNVVLVQLGIR